MPAAIAGLPTLPVLLAALLLAGPGAAAAGPGGDPEGVEADPAAGEATAPRAVPAQAGPGATDPAAVPAVAPGEAAAEVAGPTGDVPARPLPAVVPGPVVPGARADDRHRLSFAPEVVFPLGDWADATGAGFGLEVAYEYRATDRLAVTGRLGYIVHLEREVHRGGAATDLHTHEVPLLAGVRYAPLSHLYGAVEAGLVHFKYETEVGDRVGSDDAFHLGGAVGLGYRLDRLDVGARLFLPDLVGRDQGTEPSAGLAVQASYVFAGP